MKARIASVTVAYNPDIPRLREQFEALAPQVAHIIVVDNGSRPPLEPLLESGGPRLTIVAMDENQGIARGLNVGIDKARELGADFVLLLDHDSIPAANMVAAMAEAYGQCAARAAAHPVAALGPRIRDSRDAREYPFVRLGWLRNRHLRCAEAEDGLVECDFLITSGKLVAVETLAQIGPFEEGLFIDSVDREWCFRARAAGYSLYGVCAAELDHRLGDHRLPVPGGIELVVHSPLRLYYMTRNRMLLYQRAYVPWKWKAKDLLRVLAKFAATLLLVAPRGEYARMTFRAVRDALARRGGKFRDGPT